MKKYRNQFHILRAFNTFAEMTSAWLIPMHQSADSGATAGFEIDLDDARALEFARIADQEKVESDLLSAYFSWLASRVALTLAAFRRDINNKTRSPDEARQYRTAYIQRDREKLKRQMGSDGYKLSREAATTTAQKLAKISPKSAELIDVIVDKLFEVVVAGAMLQIAIGKKIFDENLIRVLLAEYDNVFDSPDASKGAANYLRTLSKSQDKEYVGNVVEINERFLDSVAQLSLLCTTFDKVPPVPENRPRLMSDAMVFALTGTLANVTITTNSKLKPKDYIALSEFVGVAATIGAKFDKIRELGLHNDMSSAGFRIE